VISEQSLSGTSVTSRSAVSQHGSPGSTTLLRILSVALPMVLAGYALLDRGFAYLASVPGTPVFAAELILLLGGAYAVLATGSFRLAVQRSVPAGCLLAFTVWGLARTAPDIPRYGLDAIRDAALWYYALTAILVAAMVRAAPTLPQRWARWYAPLAVVLLLWSGVGLLLSNAASPVVPGTGVPLFAHKPGNIAVAAVIALSFLWLVPGRPMDRRVRALLTALATIVILAVGTQNRGGLLAASAGLLLTAALMGRRGWRMAAVILVTVLAGLVTAWGLDIHVQGSQGRDYSVAQLIDNLASIPGGGSTGGQLSATVEFRNDLWSGTLNLARDQGALVTGLGFGPNLAAELGLQGQANDPLRSPHNSHVDVLARMGFVGAALWLLLWMSWYSAVLRRLIGTPGSLSQVSGGVLKVCLVGVTAILVNAYFDPTLESPQAALWLWTLVGLGVALAAPHRAGPHRAAPR
jgi:uncharacterized membrane protein SirB2